MAVNLSQGILPGLEMADKLRNSRALRESQAQEDMIKLANFQTEQQATELEGKAFQELNSIMTGQGRDRDGDGLVDAEDMGELMVQLGTRMGQAGYGKRAQELLEAGVKYTGELSEIEKRGYDQDKVRLENMAKAGEWVAQNIGENESEYRLFLSQLKDPNNPIARIIGEDNVQALENTPWSPDLVNYFKSKAISIKDQAQLALSERRVANAETATENARRIGEANTAINEARLREQRLERERKEKADGSRAHTAPTKDQRGVAESAILSAVKEFGGARPKEDTPVYNEFNMAVDQIAGRAQQIVKGDKGVTFPEAVEQAVMEAQAAGDFEIVKTLSESWLPFGIGDSVKTSISYKRRGGTANNPLPLPEDKSKWVRGRFYERNGKVGQYGTDFE
jgi:hypothetical protein